MIEPLGKQHKATPIPWERPVFQLDNFTVDLVKTNIEKCDMQFVTETFTPQSIFNNTVGTVSNF